MKASGMFIFLLYCFFHLTEARSLASTSNYDFRTEDVDIKSRYWTEWSTCSVTCGSGQQTRRLCGGDITNGCQDEDLITKDSKDCYMGSCTEVEWSMWSECDSWFMITRTRCHEDVCEEEYADCEEEGGGSWSEWGDCVVGLQEREKCDGEYGCVIEEQECGEDEEDLGGYVDENFNLDYMEWGGWEPCTHGYRSRTKCVGDHCSIEEDVCEDDNLSGSWSVWGECKTGKKLRTRCSRLLGCEIEEMHCVEDEEKYSGLWSGWGPCSGGYQIRERCIVGYGCTFEERICAEHSEWSEWGECKDGYQGRERCDYGGCEEENRSCRSGRVNSNWSEWGECNDDYQERRKCDEYGCSTEERPCVHERVIIKQVPQTESFGQWITL